jgi:hypothetical protein
MKHVVLVKLFEISLVLHLHLLLHLLLQLLLVLLLLQELLVKLLLVLGKIWILRLQVARARASTRLGRPNYRRQQVECRSCNARRTTHALLNELSTWLPT